MVDTFVIYPSRFQKMVVVLYIEVYTPLLLCTMLCAVYVSGD